MGRNLKKIIRFIKDLSIHFSRDFATYFYKGWQARLIRSYAVSFARSLIFYLNQFRIYLHTGGIQHHHIRGEKIKRLQQTSFGLHALLPQNEHFSYSILIVVNQPRPTLFQESLESVLNQTAPHLEILIGFMQPPSRKIEEILANVRQNNPSRVQVFNFPQMQKKEGVINQLVEKASGNFLFIMGEEDWIRPDFFLRYEQTLRIFANPEKRVLYCNQNFLSDKGYFIPGSEYRQPYANFAFLSSSSLFTKKDCSFLLYYGDKLEDFKLMGKELSMRIYYCNSIWLALLFSTFPFIFILCVPLRIEKK